MSDSIYKKHWDSFVTRSQPTDGKWPGDEWGTAESWQRLFENMFVKFGVEQWRSCVEIGSGSGKYTSKVLTSAKQVRLISADISPKFQAICHERLSADGLADRVAFVELDFQPGTLLRCIGEEGFVGKVDGFFSIDAMVHVDLQHLVVYLVTAAVALRPGGKLILTLANSTSDRGFEKLIREAAHTFSRQDQPTGKFEWMSPDMVLDLFPRLGFAIDFMNTKGRDIALVASKVAEPAAPLTQMLN